MYDIYIPKMQDLQNLMNKEIRLSGIYFCTTLLKHVCEGQLNCFSFLKSVLPDIYTLRIATSRISSMKGMCENQA